MIRAYYIDGRMFYERVINVNNEQKGIYWKTSLRLTKKQLLNKTGEDTQLELP